jgi:hypothetical protein
VDGRLGAVALTVEESTLRERGGREGESDRSSQEHAVHDDYILRPPA